jgi:hypothetical protein
MCRHLARVTPEAFIDLRPLRRSRESRQQLTSPQADLGNGSEATNLERLLHHAVEGDPERGEFYDRS